MDAITLLKNDHKNVNKLFRRFEDAGDRAYVEKRRVVDRIIEELSVHAALEEQLFYPAVRASVPDTEDTALESIEEHHVVKWLLHELEDLDPEDERFTPKVTVLIENVRHHVEEEESDLFPKVRSELGRNDLADLGEAMEAARSTAPTRPHPKSPDTPPANIAAAVPAAIFDRVTHTVSGVAQGTVLAVKDLVARITNAERPSARPTGSRRTRSTAKQVRSDANDAADSAKKKVRDAAEQAETAAEDAADVAKTAKSGAKATATSARKGASRTKTTAKRGASATKNAAEDAGHAA